MLKEKNTKNNNKNICFVMRFSSDCVLTSTSCGNSHYYHLLDQWLLTGKYNLFARLMSRITGLMLSNDYFIKKTWDRHGEVETKGRIETLRNLQVKEKC